MKLIFGTADYIILANERLSQYCDYCDGLSFAKNVYSAVQIYEFHIFVSQEIKELLTKLTLEHTLHFSGGAV